MVLEQIKDIILMKEGFGSVKVQSQHGLTEHDSGKASVIILYSRTLLQSWSMQGPGTFPGQVLNLDVTAVLC